MGLLDDLVEPFERVEPDRVAAALREGWGADVVALTLLDTERDDTFRVDLGDGSRLLAKVAHPNDSAELLDLQDSALAAVARRDPELPVPRVIPGDAVIDGRRMRVLTWLPGSPAGAARLPLRRGGELLGRLSRALAGFEHPAADRILPWDLRRVPDLAPYTDEPVILDAIARYTAEVSPVLAAAPQQIVHSDFHPENVLADEAGTITGVIDFGDIVRTARVCDVGVALGYLVRDEPLAEVRREFLAGFEQSVALTDPERAALPGLVVGRQIQRIVINDELGRRTGERADPERRRGTFRRALEDWT